MKYLILLFLFLSGATGLIYEVIWTRQLILIFGSTTFTVIAVLSSFMAGLAIGSFIFGKIADRFRNLILLYSLLEIGIGVTTLLFPTLSQSIRSIFVNIYSSGFSNEFLLALKFILVFPIIIFPTMLMGGTLPVVISYLKSHKNSLPSVTSLAYGINTFGAVIGTLVSAFFLIELFGLLAGAGIASLTNLSIGLVAFLLSRSTGQRDRNIIKTRNNPLLEGFKNNADIYLYFGLTGIVGMAYEVIWTRLLTPLTGTYVYAFAIVLSLYLLGITLGSFLAKLVVRRFDDLRTLLGIIQFVIGAGAFLMLFLMSIKITDNKLILIPFLILPATVAMGLVFPIVSKIKISKDHEGSAIGSLYAFNTIGSLIGPILAGFVIIPFFGSVNGIFFLIVINFLIGVFLVKFHFAAAVSTIALFGLILLAVKVRPFLFQPYQLKNRFYVFKLENFHHRFLEDYTASVLAYRAIDKSESGLLVDGVGMSDLVDETKFMAHLPLLLHQNPKDMLIIAFGMGTTFRSALTYGINVDAVDLVPSVPKNFDIFFDNAPEVLNNPKAKIIINDGRNYVLLSKKKYDVIQVDPPPPVNSAGTTLLYSREFYRDSKKIMKPGGIFNQWVHEGTTEQDFKILIRTFIEQFKYIQAFKSLNHMGLHLLGSDEPIVINESRVNDRLENPVISKDLREWSPWLTNKLFLGHYYGNKDKLLQYSQGSEIITDDHPRIEYFLIRHYLQPQVPMEADNLPQ